MNTGVVASRYAIALLKFVGDAPDGEEVCAQAQMLEKALYNVPMFQAVVDDPAVVSVDKKISLFTTAAGGSLSPKLETFIRLVLKNRRENLLIIIFHDFVVRYLRMKKILVGHLVSAVSSPGLEDSLRKMVKEKTGYDVRIVSSVDSSLIGGFVFTVDDYRIDASVAGQLSSLRRRFIEKKNRII